MAQSPSYDTRFQRLFTSHRDAMWAYCYRRLHRDDVSDAVAEVFLVVWRRIDQVPVDDEALLWLYGVARKVVSNANRSTIRRQRLRTKVASLRQPDAPAPDVQVVRRAVCAERIAELDAWTQANFRRSPTMCGHCLAKGRVQWPLRPGDRIRRKDLHDLISDQAGTGSGQRQGGISTPQASPNVLLFTDPRVGEAHGYYDGWGENGYFHYTGEGQRGDQTMTAGNRAILEHLDRLRNLRLIEGSGGEVR